MIKKNKTLTSVLRFFYHKTIVDYRKHREQQLFLKNAPVALQAVDQVFKELNIQYWLEYGTLLGAIRDKTIIKHDYDIDIGLFLADYSPKIQKTLEKNGFKKKKTFLIDNGEYGREETWLYKNISIDLFYFIKTKNTFCSHSFRNERGKSWAKTIQDNGGLIVEEVYFPYTGFKKIYFLGKQYPVPTDSHQHLKAHYGEGYLIQDLVWDYRNMAKNVKILNNKIGIYKEYL